MKLKSKFEMICIIDALVRWRDCIPLCAAAEEAATPSDIQTTEVIVLRFHPWAAPHESASHVPDDPSHDEIRHNRRRKVRRTTVILSGGD